MLYYASNILADAGFAAGKDAEGVSVLLGLFKLAITGALPSCTHALSMAAVHMYLDTVAMSYHALC